MLAQTWRRLGVEATALRVGRSRPLVVCGDCFGRRWKVRVSRGRSVRKSGEPSRGLLPPLVTPSPELPLFAHAEVRVLEYTQAACDLELVAKRAVSLGFHVSSVHHRKVTRAICVQIEDASALKPGTITAHRAWAFYFRKGGVVFWGASPDAEQALLLMGWSGSQTAPLADSYEEMWRMSESLNLIFPSTASAASRNIGRTFVDRRQDAVAIVPHARTPSDLLGISFALELSVKCNVFEEVVEATLQDINTRLPVIKAKLRGGEDASPFSILIGFASLRRISNEIFDSEVALQQMLYDLDNLRKHSGVDELLWETPHVENQYETVLRHFDVHTRIIRMITEVEHTIESCKTFNEHVRHGQSQKLELWIIVLISAEILVVLLESVYRKKVEDILAERRVP